MFIFRRRQVHPKQRQRKWYNGLNYRHKFGTDNNNNTSVFRRRGSQVAWATRSYDRLHRFSRIVLCYIRHPVLFNAIRRSFSMSALVVRHMPICCRSVSCVLGRLVLGRPRCLWSPSVSKYADIAWFAGAFSSKRRMWPNSRHRISITALAPFVQVWVANSLWPFYPDEKTELLPVEGIQFVCFWPRQAPHTSVV